MFFSDFLKIEVIFFFMKRLLKYVEKVVDNLRFLLFFFCDEFEFRLYNMFFVFIVLICKFRYFFVVELEFLFFRDF